MAADQNQINLANVDRGEISQPRLKSNACCPQTGKLVVQRDGQKFLLPGGEAMWWHCPACRGWHVIVQE